MEENKNCTSIVRQFKRVQIMFEKNLNKILEEYDITTTQTPIIKFLIEKEANGEIVQQRDIEEWFCLKNPTVTGIIDRLEAKGFVKRKILENDRRKRIIEVTDKAKKVAKETEEHLTKFIKNAFEGISKEEIMTIISLTDKIEYNLEKMENIDD